MIRRPLFARLALSTLVALSFAGCGGGGEAPATEGTTTVDGGTGVPQPPPTNTPPPTNNPPPNNPPPSNPPPNNPPPSNPPPSNPPQPAQPQPLPTFASHTGFDNVVAATVDPQTGTVFAVRSGTGDVLTLATVDETPQVQGQIALTTVRALAFDPQQPRMFAVVEGGPGADDVLHVIDTQSLQTSEVGTLTGCTGVEALAFRQDVLYAVDTVRDVLVRVDVTNATPTDVGDLQLGDADIQGLAYDSTQDELLGCDASSGAYVTIDTTTGVALQGAVSADGPFQGMTYSPTEDRFYAVSRTAGTLHEVDPRGSWIGGEQLLALAYDRDAGVLYGVHRGHGLLTRIDPTSGWKQPLGLISDAGIEGLAYDPSGPWLYALSATTRTLYRMAPQDASAEALGVVTGLTDPGSLCYAKNALYAVDRASTTVMRIDVASRSAVTSTSIPGHTGVQSLAFDPARDVLLAYADTTKTLLAVGTNAGDPVTVVDATLQIPNIGGLAWLPQQETLLGTHLAERRLATLEAPTPPATLGFDAVHALAIPSGAPELLGFDTDTRQLLVVDVDAGTASLRLPILPRRIEGAAVDPENNALFVADANAGTLLRMQPSGQMVALGAEGALGTGIRALAYVPPGAAGVLVGFDTTNRTFVTIDTTTGVPTALGAAVPTRDIQAMTFDADTQRILALDRTSRMLMEVNPSDGSVIEYAQVGATDVRGMAALEGTGELVLVDATLDQVLVVDRFDGSQIPSQSKPSVHRGTDDALVTLLWPRGDVREGQVGSFAFALSESYEGGGTIEFRTDGKVIETTKVDPEFATFIAGLPHGVANLRAGSTVTWSFLSSKGKRIAEAEYRIVKRPAVTKHLARIAASAFYDAHAPFVREHVAAHVLHRSGLYTEALTRTLLAAGNASETAGILSRDIRVALAALGGDTPLTWEAEVFTKGLRRTAKYARKAKALLAPPKK